jgi:hypothetical protein
MHGRDEKLSHNFVRKSEGKKPLGRSKRTQEDNMIMDPRYGGGGDVN